MGVFARFIGEAPTSVRPELMADISDKIITPATLMTATRPALAIKAAKMLVRGERPVTPVVAFMAATDAEGAVARLMDKLFPELGRGTTRFGIAADKHADIIGLSSVACAALRAPNVSEAGKFAVATILGQEGIKAAWALSCGAEYSKATGKVLDFPPSPLGKEAMVEKFVGITAAVATGDTDSKILRTAFGATALAFAGSGAMHGEQARRDYAEQFETMMFEINQTEAAA